MPDDQREVSSVCVGFKTLSRFLEGSFRQRKGNVYTDPLNTGDSEFTENLAFCVTLSLAVSLIMGLVKLILG